MLLLLCVCLSSCFIAFLLLFCLFFHFEWGGVSCLEYLTTIFCFNWTQIRIVQWLKCWWFFIILYCPVFRVIEMSDVSTQIVLCCFHKIGENKKIVLWYCFWPIALLQVLLVLGVCLVLLFIPWGKWLC